MNSKPDSTPRHADDDGVDTFSAAPDGIVVVDGMGLITAANAQLGEMFGYARDELVGCPVEILLPGRFHERHVKHREAYTARPTRRSMGEMLQLYGRHKRGEEFAVDVSLNYERVEGRELRVIAFVRDANRAASHGRGAANERGGLPAPG